MAPDEEPIPSLVLPVVADVPAVVTGMLAAADCDVPDATTTETDPIVTLMAVFPWLDAAKAAQILGFARGNVRTSIKMFLGA